MVLADRQELLTIFCYGCIRRVLPLHIYRVKMYSVTLDWGERIFLFWEGMYIFFLDMNAMGI